MFEVERYHDFSAGHRVAGHENACAHLHGHNYRVRFVCQPDLGARIACPNEWHKGGPAAVRSVACPRCDSADPGVPGFVQVSGLDDLGRVIDFSVIKSRLCEWLERNWDHRFIIWNQDTLAFTLRRLDAHGVVTVPFNPTAENMARYLVEVVGPMQLKDTGVVLARCVVEETRKCQATFTRDSIYRDT